VRNALEVLDWFKARVHEAGGGNYQSLVNAALVEHIRASRMRHKVVHDYLGVDEDIVWQVVTEDLPPLVVLLEKILATSPGSNA